MFESTRRTRRTGLAFARARRLDRHPGNAGTTRPTRPSGRRRRTHRSRSPASTASSPWIPGWSTSWAAACRRDDGRHDLVLRPGDRRLRQHHATLPVPISNYEIARLVDGSGDEVLVVFGGRTAAGTVTTTVQGYYPVGNTTITFATDPYPLATSPGGVAVVANKAYVFGGFDAVVTTATTHIFDITAAAGSTLDHRAVAGPGAQLHRHRGRRRLRLRDRRRHLGRRRPARSVDRRETGHRRAPWRGTTPASPTCRRSAPAPTSAAMRRRRSASMPRRLSCWPASIVVAGCGQWPNEIAQSMIYDVALNSWDTSFPVFNLTRRNHSAALVPTGPGGGGNPGMWIWGGRQLADTTVLATPEFFDLQSFPDLRRRLRDQRHDGLVADRPLIASTHASTQTCRTALAGARRGG